MGAAVGWNLEETGTARANAQALSTCKLLTIADIVVAHVQVWQLPEFSYCTEQASCGQHDNSNSLKTVQRSLAPFHESGHYRFSSGRVSLPLQTLSAVWPY